MVLTSNRWNCTSSTSGFESNQTIHAYILSHSQLPIVAYHGSQYPQRPLNQAESHTFGSSRFFHICLPKGINVLQSHAAAPISVQTHVASHAVPRHVELLVERVTKSSLPPDDMALDVALSFQTWHSKFG